ncbi:hypothetical protein [Nocardioides ganghwensis]|uniref:PKD domain-containing protein n=1 Tax=Nocardioides ganghwensis TaxID=252230 RepID=A0A4V1RMG3_9ACTN|nr:hypothetical protein [Nocardioides ganghwensis]MBD3944036.1 hypothetical protein [Nocardioides ganghwensis]RYC01531.1 hypothetical protein EUA07_11470 [Nocardioides ganghwensis]
MRQRLWIPFLAWAPLGGMTLTASPAVADPSSCIAVGWEQADAECSWTFAEYQESSGSGDGHTWVVTIQCGNGGICAEHVECVENGEEGFMHDVFRDGVDVGDVCVPEDAVQEVDLVKLIIREFKRMEWPASTLVVQPRGGKTLVNFKTNFYTPDHRLIEREVTLAGQPVTIRAVPVSYKWHFGDGTSTTTTSPGSPHPDLEITHEYANVDEVAVRVDTTYAGEFRIGNGDWASIPETLTVAGAAQDLQIVEALPQLVLR